MLIIWLDCVWRLVPEISPFMPILLLKGAPTHALMDTLEVRSLKCAFRLVITVLLKPRSTGVTLWPPCASTYAPQQLTLTAKTSQENVLHHAILTLNMDSQTISQEYAEINVKTQSYLKLLLILPLILVSKSVHKAGSWKIPPTNVFKFVSQDSPIITVDIVF